MRTGVVKFYNSEKGFGFIIPDEGGPDVFCHIRELRASGLERMTEGQRLSFDAESGKSGKGPKAIRVVAS